MTDEAAGGPYRGDDGSKGVADGSTSIPTPCLVVDEHALDHNIVALGRVLPGPRCRPHVKAFKCTSLAARLAEHGHTRFTCATVAEVRGMLDAGLGDDLLLANETVDVDRLRTIGGECGGRVTVAVDSSATISAAAQAGIAEVLIDVNVGLPRCGCHPEAAGELADEARSGGLTVRGVMGYEGHLMMVADREERVGRVRASMRKLLAAAEAVGAPEGIVSAGGTGTFDTNTWATEIQAGSYTLMDTHYDQLDLGFKPALWIEATIISIAPDRTWLVADAGLKAHGMDHGNPTWPHGDVMFCSDEHITVAPTNPDRWSVGDRVRLLPAHVDPTVAKHEKMWLLRSDGGPPIEWPVDLRGW